MSNPRWTPEVKLNNRPPDLMHNHEHGKGRIVYAGFSEKAPMYHLFRCEAFSDPPRRQVELKPFQQWAFTPESKAGRGGCSLRHCPGEAVEMNKSETTAYCTHCAQRVRDIVPCPWASIALCAHRWVGQSCATCATFEKEEVA
jgi:hypothetical protein